MSLVVSVRTLDGIVIAGDTVTTITITQNTAAKGQIASSFAASSSTTKVFSFLESYGVGVTGHPLVGGRSVGSIIRELEEELLQLNDTTKGIQKAAEKLGARIRQRQATDAGVVQLLVCGYDGDESRAVSVKVQGGNVTLPDSNSPATGPGLTVIGESHVVRALWRLAKERNTQAGSNFFSLRDGIEQASFLIQTTKNYQRFFLEPQTVGGGTDIGLIEPKRGFTWIQRESHVVPER